jgi:hypothetical protein
MQDRTIFRTANNVIWTSHQYTVDSVTFTETSPVIDTIDIRGCEIDINMMAVALSSIRSTIENCGKYINFNVRCVD